MKAPSIGFVSLPCALGHTLIAGTSRGVCFVRFGRDGAGLEAELARSFPAARLERAAKGALPGWARAIADYVDGRCDAAEVPIDVRGSQFEQRVWRALREIPQGETCSYGELARRIGAPHAAGAVAHAINANPAPVAIPCHRVTLKNGGFSGGASSVSYQRAMLRRETTREAEPATR
jgi:AraC family transcriptional regulator of adaptative response/methylated-DNA-[protein]-cysteine methyltransferase